MFVDEMATKQSWLPLTLFLLLFFFFCYNWHVTYFFKDIRCAYVSVLMTNTPTAAVCTITFGFICWLDVDYIFFLWHFWWLWESIRKKLKLLYPTSKLRLTKVEEGWKNVAWWREWMDRWINGKCMDEDICMHM